MRGLLVLFLKTSVKQLILQTFWEMLLDYAECLKRFGSLYRIRKAIDGRRLFKVESGVYSDTGDENELEIVQWKHPRAIMTLDSAYFYHNLTDEIPTVYSMATDYGARKIADPLVKQYFMPRGTVEIGKTEIEYAGDKVRTYDLERLVIETARMKSKIPYDLYKEVVLSFRRRIAEIVPATIQIYLRSFPKRSSIERIIGEEIF